MLYKWLEWENGKAWGILQCPMLGCNTMTFYPKDCSGNYVYTDPFVLDGFVYYYRFDTRHSGRCWDETRYCIGDYKEGRKYMIKDEKGEEEINAYTCALNLINERIQKHEHVIESYKVLLNDESVIQFQDLLLNGMESSRVALIELNKIKMEIEMAIEEQDG